METMFIAFDVLFRFAFIGMLYGFYKIAKECWYTFTHLDEYEYNDWDEDEAEFLCACGMWVTDEQMEYVNGRWVCDYCVF